MSVKTKTTKIRVENIPINSPRSIWNDWKMHLFRNGLRFRFKFFAPRINSRTILAFYTYYRRTVEHKSISSSKKFKDRIKTHVLFLHFWFPFVLRTLLTTFVIQMMMRKERMARRPKRRCLPAEITSCTSWPCPGNWSLPWSLPPVSRRPSL